MRQVDIPLDSNIANKVRSHKAQSKAEQEHLKRLVLQNEKRQENEDFEAIGHSIRARGIKVKVVPS